jgi:hypothetical protein
VIPRGIPRRLFLGIGLLLPVGADDRRLGDGDIRFGGGLMAGHG